MVLRHAGCQQTTVTIQNIAPCGWYRLVRWNLFFGYFEPFVTFYRLNVNNPHKNGDKAAHDEDKNDGEAPHGISLLVRHIT
jgi:hypothetical protein